MSIASHQRRFRKLPSVIISMPSSRPEIRDLHRVGEADDKTIIAAGALDDGSPESELSSTVAKPAARKSLDTALGMMIPEKPTDHDPVALEIREQIKAKMRDTIREILDQSEKAAADVEKALASIKPLTLRRRILNWFERG